MDEITIETVLADIRNRLHLSKEAETDLLMEIRAHLEDAVADARAMGEDERKALIEAANMFMPDDTVDELQSMHAENESTYALMSIALPVLMALLMRWITFAPDGTALGWQQVLQRPSFWAVAFISLVLPALLFKRWKFALVGWAIFWLITVIFILIPPSYQW